MTYEEKIKAIAYTYGRDRQTVKACEEFAEAAAAAARLAFARHTEKDGGKYMSITPLENALASECADVLVLIKQLCVLIPGFAGRVDLAMHEKIDRQIDRIAKEENHA